MATPEQTALSQSLSRLAEFAGLPSGKAVVLDVSGHDADVSGLFLSRGCDTARLKEAGGVPEGVTAIGGSPAATLGAHSKHLNPKHLKSKSKA